MQVRLLGILCVLPLWIGSHPASATDVFDWASSNGDLVRGTTAFSLEVGGIQAVAEAYVAEWDGFGYEIFGPFPTSPGFTTPNADGFLSTAGGLALEEGSIGGIVLSGNEICSGGGCGFDSGFYNDPVSTVEKFNFVLIEFDELVDLDEVSVPSISNFDHDFWIASSDTAPDLGLTFGGAFAAFATSLHEDGPQQGATGLSSTHRALRYLAIGSTLNVGDTLGLANPDNERDTVNIRSATLPEPTGTGAAWGGALLVVLLARRHRRRAARGHR